jgi:nucleotide-binding universal stress UspA family protein
MDSLKILIPTDFSVQADFAYLMVKTLEEKIIIDIHFLHVLQVPDTVTLNAVGNIETCGEIDIKYIQLQKDIAEKKLAHLKTLYGSHINTHLVLGKITDAILNFSTTNQFNLVVMGTKGVWGFKEKLSGSETQIIANKSKVPLLSLMCNRSNLQIKNILLVHNFSHPAKEELSLLHKLVNAFNTSFHLLQITSGKSETEQETIEKNMKIFAELNNITHYKCHVINDKDVEDGVISFTQKINIDIVCIGTHGKASIFNHNTTEKLINHLFKPIISFQLNN